MQSRAPIIALLALLGGNFVKGVKDCPVTGAAAYVSIELALNLGWSGPAPSRLLFLSEEAIHAHDHARRAEATLAAIVIRQGFLQGVKAARFVSDSTGGDDRGTITGAEKVETSIAGLGNFFAWLLAMSC